VTNGFEVFNPSALGEPSGWNNGLLAPAGGRLLFVAGQTARGPSGRIESPDFAEQFGLVLDHILTVVREAGGEPEHVGRLTIFVADLPAYRASRKEIGEAYRARMGRHYPAMALVEVAALMDEGALLEIEATAVLPAPGRRP